VVASGLSVATSAATVVTAVEGAGISTLLKSIHGHGPDGAAWIRYLGRALVGNNTKERWIEHTTRAQELQAVKQH